MSQRNLRPEDRAKLDRYIADLESKVTLAPTDESAVDVLLTLLESYQPEDAGIGAYSACQKRLFDAVSEADLGRFAAEPEMLVAHLRTCAKVLDEHAVYRRNKITQAYQGINHVINGQYTHCEVRMAFFKRHNAITKLCMDCYKVQILPATFPSFMKMHFMMKYLELPRDCSRKAMVEMREFSPYAYKGYIYCESEEEASTCLSILRDALSAIGVSDILLGLSRGCTEFGMEFPDYKYSSDGRHRSFERPQISDRVETDFLASNALKHFRPHFNTQGITIRDFICYYNWFHYAELIGDETRMDFAFLATDGPFEHMTERVTAQAEQRLAELAELKERVQAQN